MYNITYNRTQAILITSLLMLAGPADSHAQSVFDSKILVKLNENPKAYGIACAINIFIDGKFAFQNTDVNLKEGYMFIRSTSEPLVDRKISWIGDVNRGGDGSRLYRQQIDRQDLNDMRTCANEKGEAWVADLVSYEWKIFEAGSSSIHVKCVNVGLDKRGMKYYTARQNQPGVRYLPFRNSNAQQLVQRCASLAREEASMIKGYVANEPCKLSSGISSLCVRGLFLSQNYSGPLTAEQAIEAAIAGKEIRWFQYESVEGRELRAQKALQEQTEERKRQIEIEKRREADIQRQAWLDSPEGQRYLKAEREKREQEVRKCLTENGFFATRNDAAKIRAERMCGKLSSSQ